MKSTKIRKWTDQDVIDFLESAGMPVSRCFTTDGNMYGYYCDVNQAGLYGCPRMICMDDLDERVARVVKYLKKIGAPQEPY